MRVLIVGCGYIGLPLGATLASHGHEVVGIRRSADSQSELSKAGIKPLFLDITRDDAFAKLAPLYDWVVNCVSSSKGDADDYQATYLQGMHRLIDWLTGSPL